MRKRPLRGLFMFSKNPINDTRPSNHSGKLIGLGLVALVIVSLFFSGFYTVNEGYRAVILRNGSLIGTADPGFGIKIPFIDDIIKISIRDNIARLDLPTYSYDQQLATSRLSVSYRLSADKVDEVYSRYGGEQGIVERLIQPKVMEGFKEIFGKYTASLAIQERERLGADVNAKLRQIIQGPVVITSVQMENIDFSNEYERSVEERMLAQVLVEKEKQNLAKERVLAEIKVTQAKAQADAIEAQARAEAEAIRMRGEAEAKAITARTEALRNNAALIELVAAEKWDGKLPATMLPGSALPFVNIK
jgi:regulator of protease activity HflC (stomatin/prohibitin superfamily)